MDNRVAAITMNRELRSAFEQARDDENVRAGRLMDRNCQGFSALEYLETMLRYVTQATDKVSEAELAQAVNSAFPQKSGGNIMTTIAEKWMEQGLEQGTRNSIIEALEIRFGHLPEEIVAAVTQIHDLDALKSLFRQAVTVDSLTTFRLYLQETDQ